jgi:hypothetical protein
MSVNLSTNQATAIPNKKAAPLRRLHSLSNNPQLRDYPGASTSNTSPAARSSPRRQIMRIAATTAASAVTEHRRPRCHGSRLQSWRLTELNSVIAKRKTPPERGKFVAE